MRVRGFTLVEVLVAVALVLTIGAGVFSFAWGMLDRRDRVLKTCDADGMVEAVLDELERGLAGTVVIDGQGRAGLEGREDRLVVRSRGVGAGSTPTLGDEVEVVIEFDAAGGVLRGSRMKGAMEPLGRLGRLRVRYWDGAEWLGSYDSASAGRLPVLVEVGFWMTPAAVEEDNAWGRPDRSRVIVVPDAERGEGGA